VLCSHDYFPHTPLHARGDPGHEWSHRPMIPAADYPRCTSYTPLICFGEILLCVTPSDSTSAGDRALLTGRSPRAADSGCGSSSRECLTRQACSNKCCYPFVVKLMLIPMISMQITIRTFPSTGRSLCTVYRPNTCDGAPNAVLTMLLLLAKNDLIDA
jgi:hypothetical protein